MSRRILIIEDDADIGSLVAMHLRDNRYDVDISTSGEAGLAKYKTGNYSLVILDLMLPVMDGLAVCRAIRAEKKYTPILMLTAKSTELDRVLGLEMGADDYMTKPFSILELVARTKALFRRADSMAQEASMSSEAELIERNGLSIDVQRRTVLIDGKPVELTAKEFDLLCFFARNPGRVYSRENLLEAIWGYGFEGYEHTVNTHINRLRAKIERDPRKPAFIETVWGVGYKMVE
jgi:two-component system OmpR family response regulator